MKETTLLVRLKPIRLRHQEWTPIPMDSFYGGDRSLVTPDNRYFIGGAGAWWFGAYVRLASNRRGQRIIQFARDIEGPNEDFTGKQDLVATAGKDFITHSWVFHPTQGKPVGFKIYQSSGRTLTLEYAQLKAIQL